MGSESDSNCSHSVLISLKREEILLPSTTPTTDAAADVDNGLRTFRQENGFTANISMLLKENVDFYGSQKKKSRSNSVSDLKQILKENIAEENLPGTPKDHIVPLDRKTKTPGAPSKKSSESRVRRFGLQHMRQPDFSFALPL
ncbi:hypothetical protein SUGI_0550480 [Cryptomeria japonica]|uniref:uncharacterized protein LOC131028733 n=1 Tax=Cryptomeria japonica TaxID=3369 RepID=UPI002408D83C|nr:uncharacterized protein LOC131028733 [Cryptomeria japonica]GLJ28030.1 hypothetical protein SUGI_0550480 [Cryptomeria japonica]